MSDYDPGLVTLIVGPYTIVGFHSGSFIKASRRNDTWKLDEGAQGDPVWTRNRSKSGDFVFTLQSVSPSNKDLRSICKEDESDTEISESIPVLLKYGAPDDDGAVIVSGENARIMKPADWDFADEHTPREWTVTAGKLNWTND